MAQGNIRLDIEINKKYKQGLVVAEKDAQKTSKKINTTLRKAGVGDALTQKTERFRDRIKSILDRIKKRFVRFGQSIKKVFSKFSFSNIKNTFSNIGNSMRNAMSNVNTNVRGGLSKARKKFSTFSRIVGKTLLGIGGIALGGFFALSSRVDNFVPPVLKQAIQSEVNGIARTVAKNLNLGTGSVNVLTRLLEFIRKHRETIINFFTNIGQGIKDFVSSENFKKFIEIVKDGFNFMIEKKDLVIGAILGIAVAFGVLKAVAVIGNVASAIAFLISPIGLVLAGIVLLALAWYNNWGGIQEKTKKYAPIIIEKLKRVGEWLLNAKDKVFDFFEGFKNGYNKIKDILTKIGNFFSNPFENFKNPLAGLFGGGDKKDENEQGGNGVTTAGIFSGGGKGALLPFLKAKATLLQGEKLVKETYEKIKTNLTALLNGDVFSNLLTQGLGLEENSAVVQRLIGFRDLIINTFQSLFTGIATLLQTASVGIGVFFTNLFATIIPVLQASFAGILAVINGLITGITLIFQTGFIILTGILQFFIEDFILLVTSLTNIVVTTLTFLWETIALIFTTGIDLVKNIIKLGLAIITLDFVTAWDTIKAITSEGWNAFKQLMQNGLSYILSIQNTIVTYLYTPFQRAYDKIKSIADKIRGAIRSAFDVNKRNSPSIADTLKKLVSTANVYLEELQTPKPFSGEFANDVNRALSVGSNTDRSSTANTFNVNVASVNANSQGSLNRFVNSATDQISSKLRQQGYISN